MSPILPFINLDLVSVSVVVAATGVLGFVVFLNNRKSITAQSFLFFSLMTICWSILNYLSRVVFFSVATAFWIQKFVIFFGVFHSFSFFQLSYVFPEDKKVFSWWYKVFLLPLMVVTSILTLTPLVFNRVSEVSEIGQIMKIENGPAIPLFALVVLTMVISGIFLLIRKTFKAGALEKTQLKFVLLGMFITFLLLMVFNLILPALFNNPRFIPLGAVFIFPFIAFTSYAILKYKLFNIKVVGAAVLVFLLSIVTFLEVIFAGDLALIIYRGSIFIFVLTFGVLLIRGVLREVEQREKLATLNQKLQVAYEEVDKLSRAKSEFISIASHQLRTPLTAIKGYISLILEDFYGKLVGRAKEPMENVYKSNERLINLVNNLLSISRIESGKMEFEPEESSIEEVIDGVVSDLKITAEKKKLYLKWKKPKIPLPKLLLDQDKMRQVILNLVDNAIKYTQKGGITIKIKYQISKIKNLISKIQIIISDTGGGMDKEELAKIFESFSRGTVGTKAYTEGAGLGLYIARRFVEMHHGKIWAESEGKDKGSTFYIELPIR